MCASLGLGAKGAPPLALPSVGLDLSWCFQHSCASKEVAIECMRMA